MKVDPKAIDRVLLGELLEAGVLVFWKDPENGDYLGVKPAARREILQLPPPVGVYYQAFGVSKMTRNKPRRGRGRPRRNGAPVPVPARELTGIKEGENVE